MQSSTLFSTIFTRKISVKFLQLHFSCILWSVRICLPSLSFECPHRFSERNPNLGHQPTFISFIFLFCFCCSGARSFESVNSLQLTTTPNRFLLLTFALNSPLRKDLQVLMAVHNLESHYAHPMAKLRLCCSFTKHIWDATFLYRFVCKENYN